MTGVRNLFMLNSARNLTSGNDFILLLDDHINLSFKSPLSGPNLDEFGPRFPDMSAPYDSVLQNHVRKIAGEMKVPVRTGIYLYLDNELIKESALLDCGADAVGHSMVPEVITAHHADMKVCAFSIINSGRADEKVKSDALRLLGKVVIL